MNWAWSGHVTHLFFGGNNNISGTAEDRVVKFFIQVGYMYVKSYALQTAPKGGVIISSCEPFLSTSACMIDLSRKDDCVQGHVTSFNFWKCDNISETMQNRDIYIV